MKGKSVYAALVLAMLAAAGLVLAGCGKVLAEADVPYAASMLDEVLEGIAERDYRKFSRNFSDAMKEAIDEEAFPEAMDKMDGALGKYGSRTFLSATKAMVKDKDWAIVKYRAQYGKDGQVVIMIYISDDEGKKMIEGFSAAPAEGAK